LKGPSMRRLHLVPIVVGLTGAFLIAAAGDEAGGQSPPTISPTPQSSLGSAPSPAVPAKAPSRVLAPPKTPPIPSKALPAAQAPGHVPAPAKTVPTAQAPLPIAPPPVFLPVRREVFALTPDGRLMSPVDNQLFQEMLKPLDLYWDTSTCPCDGARCQWNVEHPGYLHYHLLPDGRRHDFSDTDCF
jgi:hypothetical protein